MSSNSTQILFENKELPTDFPNTIICYTVDNSGQTATILGENVAVNFDSEALSISITVTLSFWVIDNFNQTVKSYISDFGALSGDVVDFYMLSKKRGILLEFDSGNSIIKQYLFLFSHQTQRIQCDLYRSWRIHSVATPKIGLGAISSGFIYVMGAGRTNALGDRALTLKRIPADPLSDELAKDLTEQLTRLRDDLNLFAPSNCSLDIWSFSQPFPTEEGIFFLLTLSELNAPTVPPPQQVDFSRIGFIPFDRSKNPTVIRFQMPTIDKALADYSSLNCPMVAHTGVICCIPMLIPAHRRHWRFCFQALIDRVCSYALFAIGYISLHFSYYDRGYSAAFLTKIYRLIFGSSVIPDVTPVPTLVNFFIDIEKRTVCAKRLQLIDDTARRGQIVTALTEDGRSIFYESVPRKNWIRVHSIANPSRLSPLKTIALFASLRPNTPESRDFVMQQYRAVNSSAFS